MSVTLRDYQERAVNMVRDSFRRGNRGVMCCSPVGSGKTVVGSHIAIESAKKGNNVVVVAHRDYLLTQFADTLLRFGYNDFVVSQNAPKNELKSPIVLCTKGKVERTESKLNNPKLVIVDEAHRVPSESYLNAVMRWQDGARYLGLSATPERKGIGKLFNEILHPVHISELIEQEVLVPCEIVGANERGRVDFSYTAGGSDWEPISYFLRYGKGRKTVFYCHTHAHCSKIQKELKAVGFESEILSSSVDKTKRKAILDGFKAGSIQTVINCMVLTEGWDDDVDVLIITRACLDKKTYRQIAGRAMRKSRADKLICYIVDLTGAHTDHGSPDADQWYSLENCSLKQPCLNCGANLERSDWVLRKSPKCEYCEFTETLQPHCPKCGFHYEIPELGRAEGLDAIPKQKKQLFPNEYLDLIDAVLTRAPALVTNERGIQQALKRETEREYALSWQEKNRIKDTPQIKAATYYALVALRSKINAKRRMRKMPGYKWGWVWQVYKGWYGEPPDPKWEKKMRGNYELRSKLQRLL